ncbi:putative uracil/xanthine transporter [Paenibacillus agaridevorans]|uniref:Putative uracil/xanthine transporter n=2 Tax=Paenibacillus agaridevorans TaxID=171404 RepID=A0A2R5EPF1_9BACL|nr:putative uracil/xanthine transporter [Paenibacillus agaridevorans]
MGMSLTSIGGGIATGMLLAGFVVAMLGAFNLLGFIQKIFTPMVMNVFLFLLTFQLILIFFKGMLKTSADGVLDMPVSLFSIGIAIFVILLKIKGKPAIGNFSILIGMVVGWILYVLVFPSGQAVNVESSLSFPIFPFGKPNLNVSIIAVTFLASFVNLSNTIASVRAVSNLLQQKATESQLRRSYVLTGLFSIAASVLGLVSYATFASSIGFLESTRNFDRKPFLIGGGLMSLLGVIPFLGGILATLPITVGNAVLFAAYLQLLGTSLKGIKGYDFNSVTIHRLALPLLIGVCIMNVDATLFSGMPALLQPLLTNGFIMGVLLSILLEKLINWDKVGP